jgi:predicted transcriptional regulator
MMPTEKKPDIEVEIVKILKDKPEGLPFTEIYERLKHRGDYYKQARSPNTVSEALKSLVKKGLVQRDIDSRQYLLTKEGQERGIVFELVDAILSCRFTYTYRMHPEDLGKKPNSIMKGETKGRKIGAVYVLTEQGMGEPISCGIVNLHEGEFLHENPYWLRDIFRYALREKLINEDYFSGKKKFDDIEAKELDKLWSRLFGETRIFMTLFLINPQELLEWIKGEGKNDLKRALPKEVRTQLYREASELWKQREEMEKQTSPLKKHYQNEGELKR